MKITGTTKIAGIFGDPVAHTLSPAMQNAAFSALGIDAVYLPFHIPGNPPSSLKSAVAAIKALGLIGVNITIPHKVEVIKYLDRVDGLALKIGAVNTIVNKGGRLIGRNTDGAGYLLSLREETGFIVKGKNIIIIGAGGAARSIVYSIMSSRPKSVVIANRTLKRAASLAKEFRSVFKGVDVIAIELDEEMVSEYLPQADILVNTTSLGMTGQSPLKLPVERLPKDAVISDIVYRPLETGLLKDAKRRGLKTHNGLGMLVRQGALSFELWTGKKAPIEVMRLAALEALGL